MIERTEIAIQKKMIQAIRNGLKEAREQQQRRKGLIDNAIHFEKPDMIANSLINEFKNDDNFKYVCCKRRRHSILFLYNTESKIIYSFLREYRFRELIGRKSIESPHYIDTLLEFNPEYERQQLAMDEELLVKDEEYERKIEDLKVKIVAMLDGEEPVNYSTICYSIDGFRLTSVLAIVSSKYLEILEENDWSEFIDVDYSEVEFNEASEKEIDDELKITFKPNIQRTNNDDIVIPLKKNRHETENRE